MSAPRAGADLRVPPRLTITRLAWRLATRRPGWAIALWLCLAAALALPALVPLVDAMAVEGGLAATLATAGQITVQRQLTGAGDLDALASAADRRLAAVGAGEMVPLGAALRTGPLHVVSVNGIPAPARLASRTLVAGYLENLGLQVSVTAGQLPPEGLAGGDTAVTMSQDQADLLGLHLSDRFCVQTHGGPVWCGRLVGLWQPLDSGGPFWTGLGGPLLAMGRFDLFQLVAAGDLPAPTATLRYWANPYGITMSGVPALLPQLAALPPRIDGAAVTTGLGAALSAFVVQQRALTSTLVGFDTALTLLALCVAALVGARFLDGLGTDLNLLRARGWSRWRTGRVAFFGPGLLLGCAVPTGLAACGIATAAIGLAGGGLSPLSLQPRDLLGDLAAVAAELGALVALLLRLAVRAAWQVAERRMEPPPAWWRRPAVAAVLAPAGALALALPHLLPHPPVSTALQTDLPILPALGMALLAGALCLRPLAAWMPGRRDSVAGALAGWQIERRPEQHAAAALCLILAAAIAVGAGLGLAATIASGVLAAEPTLRRGLVIGLTVALLGTVGLVLTGFGLHFLAAAGRRLREYAGLFAHGLPVAQAARSLGAEQLVTARSSLFLGGVLGLALGLAVLPLPTPTARGSELGSLSVLTVAGALLAAELAVGRLVRRLPPLPARRREDDPG